MKKSSIFFIFMFVLLVSSGFFMRSDFFNVENIRIEASSPEIKKLTEKTLSIFKGKNMWELELYEMGSLLSHKSIAIRSVSFQRHWPATLIVKVEERSGVAQTFIDNDVWIIDSEGVSFKKKVGPYPVFWPLPTDRKNYKDALTWLERDRPRGVNGLTWNKELGLLIFTNQKMKIILGRENFSENWKKATEAMEYLKSKGLQSRRIDATYNNRAVVSL